jgi:hypothetical protein
MTLTTECGATFPHDEWVLSPECNSMAVGDGVKLGPCLLARGHEGMHCDVDWRFDRWRYWLILEPSPKETSA